MTYEEELTYEYLKLLGMEDIHETTEAELKKLYLKQAKLYHPDTTSNEEYKNGEMFSKIKNAYDYLTFDINKTNDCIKGILNPYQNYYNYNNNYSGYQNAYNYYNFNYDNDNNNIKIEDHVSPIMLLLSFLSPFIGLLLFMMLRKIFKKSAYTYLLVSILSLIISTVIFILRFI